MKTTFTAVIPGEVIHGPGPLWFSLVFCACDMVLDGDNCTAVLAHFRACREIAPADRIPGIAVVSLAMVTGEFPAFTYAGVLRTIGTPGRKDWMMHGPEWPPCGV